MDERQNQILLALRQITEEVSSQTSVEEALPLLCERIRQTTRADCCSLYLADAGKKFLRLSATDGLSKAAVGKAVLQIGEGLVGSVGQKQQLLDLADAPSHPAFKYLPDVGEDEFFSFLGVPLLNQGDLLGVLVIQSREKRQFGELEESFLVTLAAQIASFIAVNNSNRDSQNNSKRYKGETGTGGIAIAKAIVWQPGVSLEDVQILHSEDKELQQELFDQTLFQLQTEMDRVALEMRENEKTAAAFGYMSGYGHLLDDGEFQDEVDAEIMENGYVASSAVKIVIDRRVKQAQENGQRQLIFDLRDFGQIIVSRLVHTNSKDVVLDESVVLVVRSLPAAWVAELPRSKIAGFVSLDNTTSAHTAILARDLAIPSVIGVHLDFSLIDGHNVIVDGEHCQVLVDPLPSVVAEYEQLLSQGREQINLYSAEKFEKGITLDKKRITIQLNAGLNHSEDAELSQQTDGIGLYRTEIAFMLAQTFPSEQQQIEWYSKLLSQFGQLPVCMRTLDIGGDKGLDYLPIKEQNPALGWRGVRVTVDQPQILKTQLRAMLQAQRQYGNLEIMVPMISRIEEIRQVKAVLQSAKAELEEQYGCTIRTPRIGAMIEVPAIAYMMKELAMEVDFFSIGSNDLIQYMLAVDRANPKVSRFFDAFHPAVVRCLAELNAKARAYDRDIAVCGEIAGSPLGALMLLSFGYERLSMNYSELARVKYIVRRVSVSDLEQIGRQALTLGDSAAIRKLYSDYAQSMGLGRIIELLEKQKIEQ